MTDDEHIRELLREGRHREAAAIFEERGDLRGAMEAYAAVWDYGRAAEVAVAANDLASALDYLLRAGDRAGAAELRGRLATAPAAVAERAVEALLARGERDQAARLLEARGELERAADLVRDLGEHRRAAALLERAGRYREAGRLYERLVEEDPDDAASALALGNILRRFAKHEMAARMLQVAAKHPRYRRAALRGLVVALHSLGLEEAAASALEELLEEDGRAPRTVAALVALEQDTGRLAGGADDERQWIGGRYEVQRVLGGGAAGRVYLARDALYEREVALKVLAAGADDNAGRDAFARFAREAEIAAKLDHPNIVRVLEFDRNAGVLVMEYLGGGTLADRIGAGAVRLALVREVLLGLLAALETAHLRGVVHRDIKPQNVLFTRGGGVKLADFGVAHLQDLGLTQTGAFIGTLTYMAPEQITGDKVTAGTDLYGLGATVFHALCGRPPFVGADLIRQHLAEAAPAPSAIRPALGDRFDALMAKLLAKTPDRRFQNAADVRRVVETLSFEEPDEARAPAPTPAPRPIQEDDEEVLVGLGAPTRTARGEERRGQHRLLETAVVVERPSTPGRLEHLAAVGRAVSPFLQCVLDLDRDSGEVVLEALAGEALDERLRSRGPLEPARALEVALQIGLALDALHGAGQVHGALEASKVWLGEDVATLALPEQPGSGRPEDDAAALLATLARAVGHRGAPATLTIDGPLAGALGERRAAEVGAPPPDGSSLADVRRWMRTALAALADRRRAREHLHALAAAARAAGADPQVGELAAFIAARARELDP